MEYAWNMYGIRMENVIRMEYEWNMIVYAENLRGHQTVISGSQGKLALPVASRELHAFAVPRLCRFDEKYVWRMTGICIEYARGNIQNAGICIEEGG